MDTLTTIFARTSYRGTFEKTPVPREDLVKIMQAGLAAPSGCNKQTTSLMGVDDPQLMARLFKLMNAPAFETAPAMICVLTKRIIAYGDRCYSVQDYSAAIQNMLLAIVDMGYESCWLEGHITDADRIGRKMADSLGVPQDYELVCALPLGVAAQPLQPPYKRPESERMWMNGFNKPV